MIANKDVVTQIKMSDQIYPECEKALAVKDKSQELGNFITEGGYTLCKWHDKWERYMPTNNSVEEILADHFGIDLKKMEKEKQQILDGL